MVTHIQVLDFPDHGVPESPMSILRSSDRVEALVESIRGSYPPGQELPPVVVHCSAGIGRSGVFITVHTLVAQFKQHAQMHGLGVPFPFNVYEVVRLLRQQRYGMVQTAEQYEFCYLAVLHKVESLGVHFS